MSKPYRAGRAICLPGGTTPPPGSGVARSASSERSHALGILGLRLRSFGSVGEEERLRVFASAVARSCTASTRDGASGCATATSLGGGGRAPRLAAVAVHARPRNAAFL